jgi:FixJ family two-component response regulator
MMPAQKQVFIIDDDISIGRALMILLFSHGMKAKAFSSSKEFFHSVPKNISGCLILDIHMPGADGWKTLEKFARLGLKRPVILISADMSARVQERALKAGVIGYLQKPFDELALVSLLERGFAWAELN